ncbi:uncharacterized protein CCOS01_11682 [Colletotrichum costaricense]|uniref:Uncharacterized protein n=1 Tax=Colletotrichum costaricense TaxID=1209916 RepID=A0AAJ0DWT2_9PEZI|nr:uncharacterized protein CCOS01_11682 [Colletotrichum costaricense]KAK1518862.1 hypothetical protein CCOS01_11682 [Colletotrichum costaricense]
MPINKKAPWLFPPLNKRSICPGPKTNRRTATLICAILREIDLQEALPAEYQG